MYIISWIFKKRELSENRYNAKISTFTVYNVTIMSFPFQLKEVRAYGHRWQLYVTIPKVAQETGTVYTLCTLNNIWDIGVQRTPS